MELNSSISRRAMLGRSASMAVALTGLAPLVRASNKSGIWRGPVNVGEGDFRYEVTHDWAKLPASHAFGNTHGVAVDSKGFVHIAHTVHANSQSGDAVCMFDPDGQFVRSWGAEYRGGAHGLTLVREPAGDRLIHCDCNRGVVRKTDLLGETVADFLWPQESGLYGARGEYKPTNVAVVPHGLKQQDGTPHPLAGHVFIADGYGKSWIHVYDPAARYVRSFAGPGAERGQTSCPHGLIVDTRTPGEPQLLIADHGNRRLQVFTLEGRHLGFAADGVRMPCHFDQRGEVMLVPDLEARVTLLGPDNKPAAQLGDGTNFALRDKARDQFIPGQFIAPHSACFDASGNIFVVEWVEIGRVTKLTRI